MASQIEGERGLARNGDARFGGLELGIEVMDWLAKSRDFYPIENLWTLKTRSISFILSLKPCQITMLHMLL